MTVTYTLSVASANFGNFIRLLCRWKGSLWKSVASELVLWISLYAFLSMVYRNFMSDEYQVLGFYVTAVYGRWMSYVNDIGWIDTPCLFIATNIHGTDDTARMIRRNIIRYLVLTQAMVYRTICVNVKKRFPTMEHLVEAGLMTKSELETFNSIISPNDGKFWLPMTWVFNLLRQARLMKMIDSDIIYSQLMEKIGHYRSTLLNLTVYDWIPMPLVYTQVVTLAVRFYFIFALFGRQYLKHEYDTPYAKMIDLYIPILTIFQFIFYVGWMKVAEVMLNPLGDDDEDLEMNYIIDRNLQVGLLAVDQAYDVLPPQEKDKFWEDIHPEAKKMNNPMIGSCETRTNKKIYRNKRRCFPRRCYKNYKISMKSPRLSPIVSPNKSVNMVDKFCKSSKADLPNGEIRISIE